MIFSAESSSWTWIDGAGTGTVSRSARPAHTNCGSRWGSYVRVLTGVASRSRCARPDGGLFVRLDSRCSSPRSAPSCQRSSRDAPYISAHLLRLCSQTLSATLWLQHTSTADPFGRVRHRLPDDPVAGATLRPAAHARVLAPHSEPDLQVPNQASQPVFHALGTSVSSSARPVGVVGSESGGGVEPLQQVVCG
jgi:hypothetical protein